MNLPTGIVTFLLTDIEESTRYWEIYPHAMDKALLRHNALAKEIVLQHQGSMVKNRGEGDSLFSVFAHATDAVLAACALQRAYIAEPWESFLEEEDSPPRPPSSFSLRVRMALHTGEAELRDGDYYGSTINRCARIRSIGHGGQVLLSEATQAFARENLPAEIQLKSVGIHFLRDLQQPEHVYQLLHPDLPIAFSPRDRLEKFPNNLPQQVTSFVGREKEVAHLLQLLGGNSHSQPLRVSKLSQGSTRLLTLTGTGGAGKTRLSLELARELLPLLEQGVWLAELAPLSDPGLVPQTVAIALGLRDDPLKSTLQTLIEYLKSRSLLLILDNCEHLLSACASLADTLLHNCPHLLLLTSSREPLNIQGETIYRVPSLSLPPPQNVFAKGVPKPETPSEDILEYEAVRLFVERAKAAQSSFRVTEQNREAIVQICARLDGIPLALELAAARVRTLSVEQLAQRFHDWFRLLTGGSRTALPRQQTLQALIEWSYNLLEDMEKTLFCRLSVFVGNWTLEAAEAVCEGVGDSSDTLDLLSRLVSKSLVQYEEGEAGKGTYRLLEAVRQFARLRLVESGESLLFHNRHRDYCLQLVQEAETHYIDSEQEVWFQRLESEHDNLRAALQWCLENPESQALGLEFASALWWFWWAHGYLREGREWLEAAIAANPDTQNIYRAKALYAIGGLAWHQGDLARAEACCLESFALSQALGFQEGIAFSQVVLGLVAWFYADYPKATTLLDTSLTLCREMGDNWGIAFVLGVLGMITLSQGNPKLATLYCEESLQRFRTIGDKWMAYPLCCLGIIALQASDVAKALQLCEESLTHARGLGDRWSIAFALESLGLIALRKREFDRAEALLEESLRLRKELGNQWILSGSLHHLATIALYQGDYAHAQALHKENLRTRRELEDWWGTAGSLDSLGYVAFLMQNFVEAFTCYEEALRLRRELLDQAGIAITLNLSGLAALRQGNFAQATLWLQESLEKGRILKDKGGIAHNLLLLGEVARQQGEWDTATAFLQESLTLCQELKDHWNSAQCLGELAWVAYQTAQKERAARLFGAFEGLFTSLNQLRPPVERTFHLQNMATARTLLQDSDLLAAWEEGKSLLPEQAIAMALAREAG